jgi:hypothetical protein
MTPLGDENVCGFDVAMHDAFGMCSVECVRNLDSERQDEFGVQWPTTNPMFQRQPI